MNTLAPFLPRGPFWGGGFTHDVRGQRPFPLRPVAADRALSLAVHDAALAGEAYALNHGLRPGQLLRYDLPKARIAW